MRFNNLIKRMMLSSMLIMPMAGLAHAQGGYSHYPNSGISRFRWEGIVDGTAFIYVRERQVQVETRSGLPVQRQQYNFSDPLPRASVELGLNVFNGRGRVRLIEYPRPQNGYTAVIRIDDSSGGRDIYGFELQWRGRTGYDNGGGGARTNPPKVDRVIWPGGI